MNSIVFSDDPDRMDYAKLTAASEEATQLGHSVMTHEVCLECSSEAIVPPVKAGTICHAEIRHDDWCPVLAMREGRTLNDQQERQHKRYMDGRS